MSKVHNYEFFLLGNTEHLIATLNIQFNRQLYLEQCNNNYNMNFIIFGVIIPNLLTNTISLNDLK